MSPSNSTASTKTHEIIILGANFAGLGVSHYLLKHTIPALLSLSSTKTYHITLVSPSTHFFFKIGAPRALVTPGGLQDKVFLPIAPAFKQYPSEQFSFVQGYAVSVDKNTREVGVKGVDKDGKDIKEKILRYESLIIATGQKASPVWSLPGSHEESRTAMGELQESLKEAKTILIAGGGPVGVESAGEISSLYFGKGKEITLYSGAKEDQRVLQKLSPGVSKEAERKLESYGVKVVHGIRITSTSPSGNRTKISFSNGTESTVDVFINAMGGTTNSSFLPGEWLDGRGRVWTDTEGLRVHATDSKGGMGGIVPDVYAIGDVASYGDATAVDVANGVIPLGRAIGADLAAKIAADKGFRDRTVFQQKSFKGMGQTQVVPVGPKGGVGQIFGWRTPSWAVWALKARTYMISHATGTVNGESFVKG